MRYVTDGPHYRFGVCDFCEQDASVGYKVHHLGEKGICEACLATLRDLIALTEVK
jgi:hypothetical protein